MKIRRSDTDADRVEVLGTGLELEYTSSSDKMKNL